MKHRCYFIGTPLGDLSIMKQFEALAHELTNRGDKVIVLVPHRRTDLARPGNNPAVFVWPSERPTKLRDAWFFFKLVREHRPDCVVASYASVNIMILVGWLMRVPQRVAWYHTLSSQINIDGQVAPWRLKLLRLRKQLVYRLCTQIVPVSRAALKDVQSVYGMPTPKLQVFHNAVADAASYGNGHGAHRRPNHVVCIARLFPSKGQDVLIQALALLQDQHPDLRVEFIGDGPARNSYSQLATNLGVSGRCSFAGSLGHDEVLHRMQTATATILPSRSDNCPLVTIESLAVGTPVIGSRVGGIPEVVRDGIDGFLVPPDDARALADRLSALLTDTSLLQQMRTNARAGFLARFEQRGAIVSQADWLEAILSNGQRLTVN